MDFKQVRKHYDLSQTAAAKIVGVSLVTWQNWERGVTTPNEEHRIILKSAFPELKIKGVGNEQ